MDNSQMLAIVVGFFSPVVLSLINQAKWSDRVKALVGFLYAIIVGFLTVWIAGDLNEIKDIVTAILLVLVTSIAFYKGFWKPTGISPKIERLTSKSDPVV